MVGTFLELCRTSRFISTFTNPVTCPILRQPNPVNALQSCFLTMHLILSSHVFVDVTSGLFPSGYPTKTQCAYLFSAICATWLSILPTLILSCLMIFSEYYRQLIEANRVMFHTALLQVACIINVSLFCNVLHNVYHSVSVCCGRNIIVTFWCVLSLLWFYTFMFVTGVGCTGLRNNTFILLEFVESRWHWSSTRRKIAWRSLRQPECNHNIRLSYWKVLCASKQEWFIDIGKLDFFLGHQVGWVTVLTQNFVLKN